jgi:hypothetical protein
MLEWPGRAVARARNACFYVPPYPVLALYPPIPCLSISVTLSLSPPYNLLPFLLNSALTMHSVMLPFDIIWELGTFGSVLIVQDILIYPYNLLHAGKLSEYILQRSSEDVMSNIL